MTLRKVMGASFLPLDCLLGKENVNRGPPWYCLNFQVGKNNLHRNSIHEFEAFEKKDHLEVKNSKQQCHLALHV